jgi:hypothetical protein
VRTTALFISSAGLEAQPTIKPFRLAGPRLGGTRKPARVPDTVIDVHRCHKVKKTRRRPVSHIPIVTTALQRLAPIAAEIAAINQNAEGANTSMRKQEVGSEAEL